MRKKNKGRSFNRPTHQRTALFSTMATSLFLHEKITTTEAKAKELRGVAEKFITRARDNSISNRRMLTQRLSPKTVKKLMEEIAPKYVGRQGGYTRIIRLGARKSDGAKMAIIELVK
ncbi:MAG: 50S ribosomal protein L17 [bacterium]|nr:50S ribosomal protein L17 [bacterium]